MIELLLLLLMAGVVWFVSDSLKAREAAHVAARRACKTAGVQFLDDTVSQSALRLARDSDGHAVIERLYRFEYSPTGIEREQGRIRLLGSRVQEINLSKLWMVS